VRLLAEVTELARSCGMDFVILFAVDLLGPLF
jgi:hypothetical protein